MTYADKATQGAVLPRRPAPVAGAVQRMVLYKLMPSYGTYVPVLDWAEEFERSEVLEIVRLFQLLGANLIEWRHEENPVQPPRVQKALSYMQRLSRSVSQAGATALWAVSLGYFSGGVVSFRASNLSGRVRRQACA